jgi:hypothetical protein
MGSGLWQFEPFGPRISGRRWLTLPGRFPHKPPNREPAIGARFYRHPWPVAAILVVGGSVMGLSGGVSRVAKGADCKSAVL